MGTDLRREVGRSQPTVKTGTWQPNLLPLTPPTLLPCLDLLYPSSTLPRHLERTEAHSRTSLVVQRLRLHTSTAGGKGSIPG